ncbi:MULTISPECIES: hypothetical protein [unclassified Paracoccus (in: a-proteobacteria)]|uniref:hypothetical protein n=1 Tax=unclassified Paracoccus (in: a-proteobacteria) TaxID=2688777 RepID=UPI0016025018|nr:MULTISPECIES: hypothetical protein [unclassified Paracoccus (in: a-proteobacteria)]MBB1491248.1 hypothetical protein [Paracoccus sp. MC1854]MBB1498028.1 hypothetical protein [Paracoccus sp. MC1862]QQO43528.1 hypothetical protein JGR78_08590 [Paracoccus sp. MC1862]
MRNYAAVFLTLCGFAIAALVMLRPDPGVRFEAELSRLEPEDALFRLREAEGKFAFHDNLELLYGRLSLADGDLPSARRSFLRVLSGARPSEEVLEALAGIEIVAGDLGLAAAYLQQAYDLFPTPERRERLGLWYRSLRMADAERGVLQSVEPSRLTAWEARRLSKLLMAGDRGVYEQLLVELAGKSGEEGLTFKKRLLEHLAETGQMAAAVQHASAWLESDPDAGAVLEVSVRSLIGRGALDPAIIVARNGFAAAPQDSHLVLPVFAKSGHGGVARILQSEWLAGRTVLSSPEWDTLLFMAETSGDLRALRSVLASHQAALAEPAVIGRALTQFLRYRGAGALVPYRRLLSPEVQEAAPLVAAAWTGWTGDRRASYDFLLKAAQAPLSEWDQSIWMFISDGLRGSLFHRALLAGGASNADLQRRLRDSVIPARPELVTKG